jgi:hypothetical protein
MPSVDINGWAVIVAALINMVIGSFWYSPRGMGKEWMKLTGHKMGGSGSNVNTMYLWALVGALVQAYILAHFVQYTGSTSFWEGLVTGFWIWLGFVAITSGMNMMFEGRPWRLWKINAGYYLVVLLITGGLLAAWR